MPLGREAFNEFVRQRRVKPPAVVYKYTTVETARSILSTGRLRFQSPLRYNDPFDSQWDIFWPLITPEAREYETSLIAHALRDPSTWPKEGNPGTKAAFDRERDKILALPEPSREQAIAELAKHLAERPEPGDDPARARKQLDSRRRLRVVCFSANDNSILMWSHYADQHRGVALGFDAEKLEAGLGIPLQSVAYSDDLPALIDYKAWAQAALFGLPRGTAIPEPSQDWVLTKHSGWKQEAEWRIVSIAQAGTLGDYADFDFSRESLVEFLAGTRVDRVRARELQSLTYALRPDVKHFQMAEHPYRYELLKEPAKGSGYA